MVDAASGTLNNDKADASAATVIAGQLSNRNDARSQTLMEAFPSPKKDLKGVKFGSSRNPETFNKRSTVFGTTLESHLQDIKMEKPFTTELRVASV